MKEFNLLVWLTQLGMGVAVPMAGFVYLGVWLRERFSLGIWVVLCGVGVGLICAASSLRASIRVMENMTKEKKEDVNPPVSFNKHI